ncbi:type II secretion system protein [Sulfuricystis multivorans]|uniref:type II secretion system protein n=1 Tax=Sulfuricystis multivorans TaxID=2211108 RepID=UPI000F816959|nr:prepilin-type N-terminal cleavage/methylation domain-containing protein [Sulfuricystis multivorans]
MASLTANGEAKMYGRGFTLIELLVVLAILALLLSLASPKYVRSVDAAKEAVLAENLRITRAAIDRFHADRGRYPASLDELVARRYLRDLPVDPLLDSATTWRLVIVQSENGDTGVIDLKSRASGIGRNGKPYAQW